MSIHALLQAFVTIFPAELPDKSMFATIVLVTRFRRPGWVWLGVVAAFALHVVVAVTAGSLLRLLPGTLVQLIVGVLFVGGAVLLFRAGRRAEAEPEEEAVAERTTVRAAVVGSFGVILLAEWGDLTQIATASLAAKSGQPVATAIGAWLALACVAGIAVVFGQELVRRVPLHRVNYVGAAIFALLGTWTLLELLF
ncbi:TMEM165/GDT1 family protein [Aquihabitans sp. McL0605]|uniref:TMEM165/GDT1 family protein n=1 Tax=Aquihabitans sp. McL0605 TaxID=3415671 RepID=UPI003CEC2539